MGTRANTSYGLVVVLVLAVIGVVVWSSCTEKPAPKDRHLSVTPEEFRQSLVGKAPDAAARVLGEPDRRRETTQLDEDAERWGWDNVVLADSDQSTGVVVCIGRDGRILRVQFFRDWQEVGK